ncbi:MAG: hypothetical protein JW863_00130 [Chitinispirillaceae bacterium]|nr:hypothetical protein [Chitinispirillaceae bacterium]
MPTLDTLFIIIVSVMAVSLILAVVDWIYLASLASKSSILEREVEKKSQEFDALRKDRAAGNSHIEHQAAVFESQEPLADTPPPEDPEEQTIQIVRNVRGNFEQSSSYIDTAPDQDADQPHIAAPPDTSIGTLEYQTVLPLEHDHHLDDPGSNSQQYTGPYPPAEELPPPPETVAINSFQGYGSGEESGPVRPDTAPQRLRLYSDATKDADFQQLWKNINEILQNQPDALITVDLSGINFMYEKEMEYLEKINYLLAGQGGTLTFINCDAELLELINQRPQLRSLVHQKAV